MPGVIGASAAMVGAWGYFLIQGVRDPLGGINSLWPLFGIANQLLAAIALCVATTILIKMHRATFMWVTCVPLAWLVMVTYTASYQKIFSPAPRLGFLAQANVLQTALDAGTVPAERLAATQAQIFNNRLDAVALRHVRRAGDHHPGRLDPHLDRASCAGRARRGSTRRRSCCHSCGRRNCERARRRLARILMGLLRELSDESAYARHLAHHGATHSPEEWRRFMRGAAAGEVHPREVLLRAVPSTGRLVSAPLVLSLDLRGGLPKAVPPVPCRPPN